MQNAAGEDIGDIDDLIIAQNKALYAVLEVGGFLGVGGHLVAVPFDSLQITGDGSKVVLKEGTKRLGTAKAGHPNRERALKRHRES